MRILVWIGAFLSEWLERARLPGPASDGLPGLLASNEIDGVFPHHVCVYIRKLRALIAEVARLRTHPRERYGPNFPKPVRDADSCQFGYARAVCS